MPRALRIATLMLFGSLCGCVTPPPPIGADLPTNIQEANSAFDERVKARFPPGSAESALTQELARERFTITTDAATPSRFQHVARRDSMRAMCDASWRISWNASAGTIQDIEGGFGAICP
jgi:hypothetical protein